MLSESERDSTGWSDEYQDQYKNHPSKHTYADAPAGKENTLAINEWIETMQQKIIEDRWTFSMWPWTYSNQVQHQMFVIYVQVIMKIDIEGSELEVVPDLVFSGALRNTSKVFIEWHESFSNNRRKTQQMQTVMKLQRVWKPLDIQKAAHR